MRRCKNCNTEKQDADLWDGLCRACAAPVNVRTCVSCGQATENVTPAGFMCPDCVKIAMRRAEDVPAAEVPAAAQAEMDRSRGRLRILSVLAAWERDEVTDDKAARARAVQLIGRLQAAGIIFDVATCCECHKRLQHGVICNPCSEAKRDNARRLLYQNLTRVERAAEALKVYEHPGEPIDQNFIDLITDARHFAHTHGIKFDVVLRLSEDHFNTEQAEQDVVPLDDRDQT